MSRYSKAIAALVLSLAEAGALLPTDAPKWLLVLGSIVNTAAVYAIPNRKPTATR